MTDSDDKLLQRYRALSREEPPRALDDAILAASRRAVAKPSLSRRWAAPVSIAAVLVLAFGVTLEMQREQPGIEYKEPAKPAPPIAPATLPASAPAPRQEPPQRAVESEVTHAPRKPSVELRKAAPRALDETARTAREPRGLPEAFAPSPPQAQSIPAAPPAPAPMEKMRDANVAPQPAAEASAPAYPAAPAPASGALAAPRAKLERADSLQAPARALAAPSEPERELERIARLRDEGRNDEADKALEEFRRKYPGYRIADAMWPRVKPR